MEDGYFFSSSSNFYEYFFYEWIKTGSSEWSILIIHFILSFYVLHIGIRAISFWNFGLFSFKHTFTFLKFFILFRFEFDTSFLLFVCIFSSILYFTKNSFPFICTYHLYFLYIFLVGEEKKTCEQRTSRLDRIFGSLLYCLCYFYGRCTQSL